MDFYTLLKEHVGRHFETRRDRRSNLAAEWLTPKGLSLDIYYLTKSGCTSLLRELLNKTPKVKQKTLNKALFIAVQYHHISTAKYLLSRGANINYRAHKHRTVLFLAVLTNNLDMVRELLKYKKLNILATDSSNNTILLYAVKKNASVAIINLLLALPCAKWLQTKPNYLNKFPLLLAKNPEVIKSLIKHGAPINQTENFNEKTPLFYAVGRKDQEAMQILISAKCELNCKEWPEHSPLSKAIQLNCVWAVQMLLDAGASTDCILDSIDEIDHTQDWSLEFRNIFDKIDIQSKSNRLEIKALLIQRAQQIRKERVHILMLGRRSPESTLYDLPVDMIREIGQYL